MAKPRPPTLPQVPSNPSALAPLDRPSRLAAHYRDLALRPTEVLILLAFDRNGAVLTEHRFEGDSHGVQVSAAELLRGALWARASAVALVHNHPSGWATPSAADLLFTRRIEDSCFLLQLALVDHVIIASRGWLSLRDSGVLRRPA